MSRHLPTISRRQVFYRWLMKATAKPGSTEDNFDDGSHYPSLRKWGGLMLIIHNWAERRRWAEGRRLFEKHEYKVFKLPTRRGLL